MPDREIKDAKRILIASGKVGHELRAERRRRKDTSTAIFFLDQFYPLPRPEITAAIAAASQCARNYLGAGRAAQYGRAFLCVCRDSNAWRKGKGLRVRSVKRSGSASPATGSAKAHELEQKTLLALAFTTASSD